MSDQADIDDMPSDSYYMVATLQGSVSEPRPIDPWRAYSRTSLPDIEELSRGWKHLLVPAYYHGFEDAPASAD